MLSSKIINPVLIFCASMLPLSGCVDLQRKQADDVISLEQFTEPTGEARPRVWWHWMNGNISEEGIVADLEWMSRVGIGGVQNFDAAMATPVVVDQRLSYMSPQWQQAFRTAVTKADELGLEVAVASSPGWSLTGGPWVTPEDAMKKLVWTETYIEGGQSIEKTLPQPASVVGPYQTIKAKYKHGHNPEAIPDSFYRDISVIAFPVDQIPESILPASVQANEEPLAGDVLFDEDLTTGITLPTGSSKNPGRVTLQYEQPHTVQSAVVFISNAPSGFMGGKLKPSLQILDADNNWQTVAEVELGDVPSTVSFAPVSARAFRLLMTKEKSSPMMGGGFSIAPGVDPSGMMGLGALAPAKPLLADFKLFAQPKVDAFETKAAFRHSDNYLTLEGAEENSTAETLKGSESETGINPDSVIDISNRVSADGVLQWDAPAGHWKIIRLGYSLTGKTNSPATDEATGLEVDKYDRQAVARYINTYLDNYLEIVGPELMGARGLNALLMDSSESGPANWSPVLPEQFKKLRGYALAPWLPVLTGEVVGSREESDRFLHDYRQTLGQLNATEHYQTVARIAQERGLTVYSESLEGNREISTLGDDLELRRFADIPMGAMWAYRKGGEPSSHYLADMRGAASVAHIYGKKFVAAESLTSIMFPWAHAPADLQPMIDAEFLSGINRPVIHTSPHQPVDDKFPGLSLHVFGQYFTRHETWAEMAKPWMDYLSRNSYLLQQGNNVADVAYFYGEEPPISVLASRQGYPTDVPVKYAYDFVPADALSYEFSVNNGDLVSRGGARYKVLFLGKSSREFISLKLLKQIHALVKDGATLVGLPPQLRLARDSEERAEFQQLVNRLWRKDGENWAGQTRVGKGLVVAEDNVDAALLSLGVKPAFDIVTETDGDAIPDIKFVHRVANDAHIYMVANRTDKAQRFDGVFRVSGKAAEMWRADTGKVSPLSFRTVDQQTHVPLLMEPWQSYFVVFKEQTLTNELTVEEPPLVSLKTIEGEWQVSFQQGRGAPEKIQMQSLQSLSEFEEHGVKYFSGVARYTNTFDVDANSLDRAMTLDLGSVGDLAEVYINGQLAGAAWKPPYHVDITEHVKQGRNSLEVRVANLWVNRLIGDRQQGVEEPVAYTSFKTYLPSAPLRPSGLIGPVQVLISGSSE